MYGLLDTLPCPDVYIFLSKFWIFEWLHLVQYRPPKTIKLRIFVNLRFPLQSYVGLVFFVQIQGLLPRAPPPPPGFEIRKWCNGQLEMTALLFQEKAMIIKNTAFDI